jgi:hypothetical protein
MNKKIVILMGRGIEGCGITRSVSEFKKFYGDNVKVFATSDNEWIREGNENYGFNKFLGADWAQCQSVVDECNKADFVITYSLPAKDKHPVECQDNFVRMLKEIRPKKTMIHCDHSNHAMHNNANITEIMQTVDLIMSHSLEGEVGKWKAKNDITTPMTTMGVGFNYDAARAKWWKPIEEQDPFRVRWIGRTALWKGPNLLIQFHEEMLREHGYITVLEGMEASIQSPLILFHDGYEKKEPKDVTQRFRGPKAGRIFTYGEETKGKGAYLYPPYVNAECMERLSLGAFGVDLYKLAPEKYGNNIENCHAEPIAVGTVPVFHRHFGDHIVHRVTGDPVSQAKNSGTVWLDGWIDVGKPDVKTDWESTRDLMLKLSNDDVMRDEWREMAFEFWKAHSDTQYVITDIVDKIGRDWAKEEKPKSVDLENFFG